MNIHNISTFEYKIIPNDLIALQRELLQVRFPKTKRKRIRRKWAKNKKNWQVREVHKMIKIDDTFFVTNHLYGKILKIKDLNQNKN